MELPQVKDRVGISIAVTSGAAMDNEWKAVRFNSGRKAS